MTITALAHESPKRSLLNAIGKAIPNRKIAVYFNQIQIGKHFVKTSPGLKEWLRGPGGKPVKVFLKRKTMTAYIVADN